MHLQRPPRRPPPPAVDDEPVPTTTRRQLVAAAMLKSFREIFVFASGFLIFEAIARALGWRG
jgi:hypothetical protein